MYITNQSTNVVSKFDFAQVRELFSLMKFYESEEGVLESSDEDEVTLMIQLGGMVGDDMMVME